MDGNQLIALSGSPKTKAPSSVVWKPGPPGEILGLVAGVSLERLGQLERVLDRHRPETDVVGEEELQAGRLQHPPDLPLFASAPGGDQQLHQPKAARCARNSWSMP